MNGMFKDAVETDPKWARRENRKVLWVKILTPVTIAAVMIGTIALILGIHNGTEITQVEHSACQVEPGGRECQKSKREAAEDADLKTTCVPFFKAGYPCPKPGSTEAERVARRQSLRAHPVQAPATPSGGDASIAPTGHSRSGPRGSGGATDQPSKPHGPSVGDQSQGSSPSPAPPAASSSQPSSSSPTTERVESTVVETSPQAPVAEGVGKLVEEAGGTVREVGSTVSGTAEGVEATTCGLAKVLCHE